MKLLYISFLIFLSVIIKAEPIDKVTAKTVAINFMKKTYPKKNNYSIKPIIENKTKSITTTYAINFNSGGYVIVSANDATIPVFAFSEVWGDDKIFNLHKLIINLKNK